MLDKINIEENNKVDTPEMQVGNNGSVEVVCGPMFAGKTEELLRRIRRLEYAGKDFVIFKPTIDDRYGKDEIVSHNNNKRDAINVKSSGDLLDYLIDNYVIKDLDAVIVDEAQFFDKGIVKVVDHLADQGIRVIIGGLDRDFKGDPFGPMPYLLAIAENVTKLTAICMVSGEPATRSQRLINGKPATLNDTIVVVGATESYEARSRSNHMVPEK
jgi:thymidine kinase